MSKSVQLLLTENVDGLGIVGDVVNVRSGYARNYLLPFQYATTPSDEALAALAEKRKNAEKELAALRAQREAMVGKLDGIELNMTRSCNDQGVLYGAVTQQDIASALTELGYYIKPREVRIAQTIKRIDTYEVLLRFAADLEVTIKLWVVPDRELGLNDEREEMEFDNEGELIEKKPKKSRAPRQDEQPAEAPAED